MSKLYSLRYFEISLFQKRGLTEWKSGKSIPKVNPAKVKINKNFMLSAFGVPTTAKAYQTENAE